MEITEIDAYVITQRRCKTWNTAATEALMQYGYQQTSDISQHRIPKLKCFSSGLAVVLAQPIDMLSRE